MNQLSSLECLRWLIIWGEWCVYILCMYVYACTVCIHVCVCMFVCMHWFYVQSFWCVCVWTYASITSILKRFLYDLMLRGNSQQMRQLRNDVLAMCSLIASQCPGAPFVVCSSHLPHPPTLTSSSSPSLPGNRVLNWPVPVLNSPWLWVLYNGACVHYIWDRIHEKGPNTCFIKFSNYLIF